MGEMMKTGARQILVILAVFLAAMMLLACKGETPTSPTPGGGTPGGSTTPPTGASIALSASNASPLAGSTTVISANVTQGGTAVPNGTAVEFSTNRGTFTDTGTDTTVRTTTSGVATAVLTSDEPGTATVTARVNNVVQTINVTFRVDEGPVGPGSPTISSFNPTTGPPSGNQLVVIQGTNFQGPVRVLFGTTPAAVASVTPTEIRVVAPPIQLGATEQFRDVPITVITQEGTTGEQRVVSTNSYRYQVAILTPRVYDVSPSSGPNEGNTRITIFGEGFQPPTKVYFGTSGSTGPLTDQVEVEVLQVTFDRIIALTPPALGMGAELRDQQVTLRVVNVLSNTEFIAPRAFRYGPGMQITAFGPGQGPSTGGTDVTIYGWGFDGPVAVSIGGVAAQPLRVSGTEILARTSPLISPCAGASGPVTVTNIEDGATATSSGIFTYLAVSPQIIGISPSSAAPGGAVTIAVVNDPGGLVRFRIGTATVIATRLGVVDGVTTFGVTAPSPTECAGAPLPLDVEYINLTFTCQSAPVTAGLTILCPAAPANPVVSPDQISFGNQLVDAGPTGAERVTVTNTGGTSFTITGYSLTGTNAAEFAVTGPVMPVIVQPGAPAPPFFDVTFDPTTVGSKTASLNIDTSVGPLRVTLTGTGTVPPP
jgi:hypothetical protein